MKALSFTARVYKVGINPYVDAPPETGKVFQRCGFIPIAGLVNGEAYRATLGPRGGGLHNPKPKEAFSQLVSVGAARRPYLRKNGGDLSNRRRVFLPAWPESYFFCASCISCSALRMSSCAFFIASYFCCCSGVSNGRICAPVLSMIAFIFSIASLWMASSCGFI